MLNVLNPATGETIAEVPVAGAEDVDGDELAELEARNAGKPVHAMRDDEIPACVDNLRFFAGAARCLEGKAASSAGNSRA